MVVLQCEVCTIIFMSVNSQQCRASICDNIILMAMLQQKSRSFLSIFFQHFFFEFYLFGSSLICLYIYINRGHLGPLILKLRD